MDKTEQEFLNDLDKSLWNAADRLRSSLDAAVYKHPVLGLIFLKYASDAFDDRKQELVTKFADPEDEYYMDPADFTPKDIQGEIENRDYYKEVNIFWVPPAARWENLRDYCRVEHGTDLPWKAQFKGTALLLDNALTALGKENAKLGKILAKDTFTRTEVGDTILIGLIDRFSDTNFSNPEWEGEKLDLKSKDILGHVYEYFLGKFATNEGKRGGQYYTPKSIVTLVVRMLQPFRGRIYDPAMGSGGFFVQSEEFLENFGGKIGDISVYGQESNPTTWRLAAMNMAIRGIDFNFGEGPGDSFLNDLHPDLRADYVMANPPFNMKEWGQERLENDARWVHGTPPKNNANFAWMQHMLYHLAPTGSLALLLANGSMSSSTNGEGDIRKELVEKDLVECIVALPGQLFINTQIPACIWFLTKNKQERGTNGGTRRNREHEYLFIDARQKGYMKDRVLRDFKESDIKDIADTYHAWQSGEGYEDVAGYCKSVDLDGIKKHDYILTPGRFVGAAAVEDDGEPFDEKMARLTKELAGQFEESERLKGEIKKNLSGLGWKI